MSLPVEGRVILESVRFVESNVPLSKEEEAQGFYYLSEERMNTRDKYKQMQARYDKLYDIVSKHDEPQKPKNLQRYERDAEFAVGKFLRLPNWRGLPVKECKEQYVPMIEEYLKESLYRRQRISCKRVDFVNTALEYDGIGDHKKDLWKVAYDKYIKSINDYDRLETEMNTLSDDIYKFEQENYYDININDNTIFIDKPFFVNAAGMLRVMGGYIVERQMWKKVSYYVVTLI